MERNFEQSQAAEAAENETRREIKSTPEKEHLMEQGYEDIIKTHAPVDSGKEGVIYRMSAEEVSDDVKEVFQEAGKSLEDDSALKVLKVYSSGKAEYEYGFQSVAYRLIEDYLEAHPDQVGQYARIPKPIDYRKINLDEDTRTRFNEAGGSVRGKEVEVLLMDFIQGKDLAAQFYSWIVEHAPQDKQYVVQSTNTEDFHQLQQAVSEIVEFIKPKSTGKSETEREIEQRQVSNLNAKKVYDFLRRTGYRLDEKVVTQITNTRKLLEENRIYHNDEHERNYMVEDGQVFMIDFAKATRTKPDITEFNIEGELRTLTAEYERQQEAEKLDAHKKELARITFLADTKPVVDRAKVIVDMAAERRNLMEILHNRSIAATAGEHPMQEFLALLVKMENDNHITPHQARDVVSGMKKSMVKQQKVGRQIRTEIINRPLYNKIDSYQELFN